MVVCYLPGGFCRPHIINYWWVSHIVCQHMQKSIMSEIIYGIHAVKALLERDPQRFLEVFILKGRDDRRLQPLIAELEAAGLVIQVASRQWLDSQVEGRPSGSWRGYVKGVSIRKMTYLHYWKVSKHLSCSCWMASPIHTIWGMFA